MTAVKIRKAIQEAYNTGKKIKTQGNSVLVKGFSKSYDIIIKIWVDLEDMIIKTAYPVE